jgi:hypothetical protein
MPSAAQMRVLEAMSDGAVLVRGYVNSIQWYLQGSGASVGTNTAEAMRLAGWVSTDDNSGVHRYYTLTNLGRHALESARVAMAKRGSGE